MTDYRKPDAYGPPQWPGRRGEMSLGSKIVESLIEAAAGDFARVTVEGQTWVRLLPGYVIVPKEPTEAMNYAGVIASGTKVKLKECAVVYSAMIADWDGEGK